MELIKSSSSIMPYDVNPLKHIELVARNCYKSEDKITDDSAPRFVKMLYDRGHHAMLEFYPFYFYTTTSIANELVYINQFSEINGDLMIYNHPNQPFTQVSCNLRTAMMISKYEKSLSYSISQQYSELGFLFTKSSIDKTTLRINYDVIKDLRYLTARFICDRGVSHELVRHRKCSFAQESTRYCNYGKQDHIKFIIPSWINELNLTKRDHCGWNDAMQRAEYDYIYLLSEECEWSPQQARSVLPNSLKTEIIVQARLSEWKHIFEQRCSPTAHPDMRELMIPFKKKVCEISKEYNDYFNS